MLYGELVEKAWAWGGGGRSKWCCCRCIWLSGQGIGQGQDLGFFKNMQKFPVLSCSKFLSTGCSLNMKYVVSQVLSKIGSTNYSTKLQVLSKVQDSKSFDFDQGMDPRWELVGVLRSDIWRFGHLPLASTSTGFFFFRFFWISSW